MGKKYFTLSFDDGLEQDKRVIRLMRQYGLKGTFNLNAGLFGTRGEVKVKAAGGIRTLDAALRMIDLGVSRIGSTASVKIMEEFLAR